MIPQVNRGRRNALGAALAVALAATAPAASAQAHETSVGDYTLQSSVLRSEMLPSVTARAHGIVPAPNRAVLNIVVVRDGRSVRADVAARAVDLNGRPRAISVRPITANDRVSYLGVFEFLPREVLDFRIEATPVDGPPLSLVYRDRMWFY